MSYQGTDALNLKSMKHLGRLLINVDGINDSCFLWNGTESCYKMLRLSYKDIQKENYSWTKIIVKQ